MASIFTKIICGEIPSFKIYEDEHSFAFLDINPMQLGHTLIVPKVEVDHFLDLPEPHYSALFRAAKTVSRAIQDATKCKRIGTMILGWDVPHVHVHLVPMWKMGDMDLRLAHKRSPEEMKTTQEKIVAKL